MSNSTISRRRFAQILGVGAAAAVVRPTITFARSPAPAAVTGVIRLSANENPYGPSAGALQAMNEAFALAWRYPDEANERLIGAIAKLNGVAPEEVLLGDGSSEILKVCAEAFTGPGRPLAAADPTFEAILNYSTARGAQVDKVPLTQTFAHDLPKLGGAAARGLVYICNPNNPTASITPKAALRDFVGNAPTDTMILVDEAYFHFADSPDYESVIPLVKDHANLIVARTFSKIYGMAGLRCGYAIAQKQTIAKLREQEMWDSVNCMALAAATASLDDPEQVPAGQHRNKETRDFTVAQLETMGFKSIPSQANFIMFDTKRPVVPLIAALKQRNVQVGRLFPALPNHMRLTIGKRSEMEAFLSAFRAVAQA